MPFDVTTYRFSGSAIEGTGMTLEAALEALSSAWMFTDSVSMFQWGVLTMTITVAGTTATFEITDPKILDAALEDNLEPLRERLARDMEMSRSNADLVLDQATNVDVFVDSLRPEDRPHIWSPAPGADTATVLPDAAEGWVRDLGKEVDEEARRTRGRPRSRRGKELLRMVVEVGQKKQMTDSEISKKTGIPVSTVRDTKERITRERRVMKEFQGRRRGQRLTRTQRDVVLEKVRDVGNNAAEAARQLGLSPRTVRDIRQRAATPAPAPVVRARKQYDDADRQAFFDVVDQGINPTEAGRRLGIPGRTARGWNLTRSRDEGE
jgi:hypothetical protein